MRTTLDIDDTVLRAARVIADQRGVSLGTAVSELALRGLAPAPAPTASAAFPLRASHDRDHVITDELVAAHRDG